MITKDQVNINSLNIGLRNYMIGVYNLMFFGLTITGAVAYLVYSIPGLFNALFSNSIVAMLFIFAPIGVVLYLSARLNQLSAQTATTVFFGYSALMGISLSTVFAMYTGGSIARVFFVSAATFLSMSIYGYTTKNDLLKFGSFLFMGVVGILIASVINWFMKSPSMYYAISCISVLLFTGLTAYDSQKIKMMYFSTDSSSVMQKKAILGALNLYLDFLNLFLNLLHLMGNRK